MTLQLCDEYLVTIEQLESFTIGAGNMIFEGASRKEKYAWIEKLLKRFMNFTQRKKTERS